MDDEPAVTAYLATNLVGVSVAPSTVHASVASFHEAIQHCARSER